MSETSPQIQPQAVDVETTHHDILSAINQFANDIQSDLHDIKGQLEKHDTRLNTLEVELGTVKSELGTVKSIVNTLPTKDYLDQKLATQKSDIVQLIKAQDHKVVALVHELRDTKVVSEPAAQRILAMKSFAQ